MSCFSKPLHPEFFIPPLIFDDLIASDGDPGLSKVQSAPDDVKPNEFGTPTKTPRTETRLALGELVLSSSRLNTNIPAIITTNQLIDFTRGTPAGTRHGLILPETPESVLARHKRKLSKAARNTFSHRAWASQDNFSIHSDSNSTITGIQTDHGRLSRPIMHFRPNLWRHLERDRSTLNLDLFWPLKTDQAHDDKQDEDFDIFPLDEMRLLCEFRHLRSLQLNGMLQSYQKYVWTTCWLNPALEELTLEMALEPTIHDPYSQHCRAIEGEWQMKSEEEGSTEYLGQDGEGILSLEFGIGEYLDRQAIEMAKLDAAPMGGRLPYLPVVKLALSGFVIDSGALKWFDPMRLREIDIKHNCVDAGFTLPVNMVDLVKVTCQGKSDRKTVTMIKVAREDLQIVTLKAGEVVNENARPKPKIRSLVSHPWFPISRKPMARGERGQNKAGTRVSSSNSLSSLGQNSSSASSRRSQDSVFL